MNRLPLIAVLAALSLHAACSSSTASGGGGFAAADVQADTDAATTDVKSSTDAAPGTDAVGTDAVGTDAVIASGVTFHKDVEPILQAKCQGCHYYGGIAPWSLVSYQDAKAHIDGALVAIDDQTMPPWGALETAECKPRFGWQHDLRVSAAQRKTLQAWLDNGTPEGNPADAPKTSAAPTLTLQNPSLTVQPKKPFVTAGDQDQYRCFVIDPQLATLQYLNGAQVIPGNPAVVHHALVYVDENNEAAAQANADGEYDCFGGPGINGKLIEAWAPGAVPLEFPSNVGTPIAAGSKLVMQIHYHPAGKTAAPDTTQIQFRWTASKPEWTGSTQLIGNFGKADASGDGLLPGADDPGGKPTFLIPAGKANHIESMRFHIPTTLNGGATPDLRVYGVGTHMHLVGRDMKVWVDRATEGAAACTAAQLDPLMACAQTNCPGQTGQALVACAQQNCATEVSGLAGSCSSCVVAGVTAGKSVAQLVKDCEQTTPNTSTEPATECLVQTPAWNFDWQRIYNYDVPIEQLPILRGGDALNMRCTYDNTMDNPAVKEALEFAGLSAPVAVKLGETTLDEMCLAIVQVVYKAK